MDGRMLMALVAALILAWGVGAQDGGGEEPGSDPAPAEAPETGGDGSGADGEGEGDGLDLDELLGITPDVERPEAFDPEAGDPDKAELERQLTNDEAAEQFAQAVQQMQETAERIGEGGDVGLVTQRLQEEILVKLDVLIERAEQQASQSSSGGQSRSSQSGQQPQQAPAQTPSSQQASQQESSQGTGDEASMPPAAQSPELRATIDAAAASWGRLPERFREALMQGLNDRFSTPYQRETEAYYRRLAEEEDGS